MTRKSKQKKKQHQKAQAKRGRRYELTDEAFERIEPLLPTQKPGGQWKDHRTVLNGMFWILNSGAQWRDMPERYGRDRRGLHNWRRRNSSQRPAGHRTNRCKLPGSGPNTYRKAGIHQVLGRQP